MNSKKAIATSFQIEGEISFAAAHLPGFPVFDRQQLTKYRIYGIF
jgi:hypothetical protein